ncbi:MAG: tRNA pseudouridine 13 synthase [Myxococcaceae bacterium]|nr:tRNA pseudouridine 13 synthase [Myxococcaceae bacterium]
MSEPDPSRLDPRARLYARLARLPKLSGDIPPIEGTLKGAPEDFVVEELPAYPPSGTGEHLYLWIEKRELNTQDAVARLAQALGARQDGAGYAGLKDKRAVTRQWLSFHHVGTPRAEDLTVDGVRVLEVSRHVNKLRTGHLRGNRFTIRLGAVPPAHDVHAAATLARLVDDGLPNYYGSQRFGIEGRNLAGAWSWIVEQGRPPNKPFLRKLFVSTLQSALFNAWLAARIERGEYLTALPGDILRKEESGGLFDCTDAELDGARLRSWEISATGPMFGARMRATSAEAHDREIALLAEYGLTDAHFARVERAGEGTRRPARVRVSEVAQRREGDDLVLSFTLPRGSYATVLLSELTKSDALALGDDP